MLRWVGAAGAVVVGFMLAHVIGDWWSRRTDYAAAFDRDVAGAPADAPLFTAFRTGFPVDYARFRRWTINKLSHGATPDGLRAEAFGFMRNFALMHATALAQAPHRELAAWREAQIGAGAALQADSAAACAHFVNTGLQETDRPGPAALAAVRVAATAQMTATAAGTAHPTPHRPAPGPADFVALRGAMNSHGMTPADVALTVANKLATAPAAQQCRIGLVTMRGIASLPPDQADRFSAALIAAP